MCFFSVVSPVQMRCDPEHSNWFRLPCAFSLFLWSNCKHILPYIQFFAVVVFLRGKVIGLFMQMRYFCSCLLGDPRYMYLFTLFALSVVAFFITSSLVSASLVSIFIKPFDAFLSCQCLCDSDCYITFPTSSTNIWNVDLDVSFLISTWLRGGSNASRNVVSSFLLKQKALFSCQRVL